MARKKPAPESSERRINALSKRFELPGAIRAVDALLEVQAIPTRFVQFDWASRVGGWPLRRVGVVHGPSNEGKTLFMLGLGASFVEAGHYSDLVDAERTTTPTWIREVVGETAERSEFTARKPVTYEKCVDQTRELHRAIRDGVREGKLPAGTSLITMVDSLRKLVPEDIFSKISRHGASGEKGSVDGMGGRAAQIKAALNASWLDELVPLLDDCGTSWVAIVRETDDGDADIWSKKAGTDYKIGGGKAVVYDSALRLRIERESWVTVPGEGDRKLVVGERHRITIAKTKIGGKDGKASVCHFHSSNGTIAPEGFDRARDVVDLALKFGVLQMAGNRIKWPSREKGESFSGREKAIAGLREADDDLEMLEKECRSKFSGISPDDENFEAEPETKVKVYANADSEDDASE